MAACAIILKQLDPGQLGQALSQIRIGTALVVILTFTAAQIFIALRWWLLLMAQGINIRLWIAVKLTFLGLFFSNFLPGSVGGDLVRAWYAAQHTNKRLPAAISVFVDRFVGLFVTLLLAIGAYLLFMRNTPILAIEHREGVFELIWRNRSLILVLIAIAFLFLLLLLIIPSARAGLARFLSRLSRHSRQGCKMAIEAFLVYYKKPFILLGTAGLTFFFQACVLVMFWRVGKELGIDAPLRCYFVFFPVVWVIGSVPLSLAGIGILEGGLIFLFTQYAGVSAEAAAALALSQRAVWIIASLPGLFIHLLGRHLPGRDCDFSIDASPPGR